jgi:catechol 2,3-dioxygenase-like lactoylglutathione lyase family enzyme
VVKVRWLVLFFPPFLIAMSVLAASTAFYRRMGQTRPSEEEEDPYWSEHGLYHFVYEGEPQESLTDHTPLEIAQERYARGEISPAEFDEMVARLNQSRHPWQEW